MPSRTARLSKKGCEFATPECRAQRDVAVHPRPAPPPPLLAAPRLSTTALGYLEIRWGLSLTDTQVDPEKPDRRFSQRRLIECLRTGADRFGWTKRNLQPGAT